MRVQDQARLLTPTEEIALARKSEALEKDTTDQLVIVTVPSLHGQDIAQFSTSLGNRWGVGEADKDNGVLMVIAPNERKVRIAVGYGLEGLLTDARAATIVEEMLPLFHDSRHSDAIALGAQRIDQVLRSDAKRPRHKLERKAA